VIDVSGWFWPWNWLKLGRRSEGMRIAAMTGWSFTQVGCGMAVGRHFLVHAHLFLIWRRSMRTKRCGGTDFEQLATARKAAVAEMVDVVDDAEFVRQLKRYLMGRNKSALPACGFQGRVQRPI